VIVPALSRHEFDELTDLRCHVEGLAASQAVGQVGPEHMARLRDIDRAMRAAGRRGDADAYLDGNFQFHFVIYRLGASPFMLSIIEKLWVRVGPLIRSCFNETGFSDSKRHHASIIESLARARPASCARPSWPTSPWRRRPSAPCRRAGPRARRGENHPKRVVAGEGI
jgi:DNA-binding GntR family transcriptional regulator